jgi:acyl-CoA thioesterase-1
MRRSIYRWVPLLVLAVGIILAGVALADDPDPNTPIKPDQYKLPIKLACVGDSITEGAGTTKGHATSWAGDLGRMLGKDWNAGNFGASGRTLLNNGDNPYQKTGPLKKSLEFQPDVVVIMLGTNDTKPQNWKHQDQFVADYKDLIDKYKNLPSHPRIFVCRPPLVVGKGNYGIREEEILLEIPMIDAIAKDEQAGVIDIHAATLDHGDQIPDRVHPNDKGSEFIAKAVYKALTGMEFDGEIPKP